MANTAIANIIDPEVLADQISAKFPDQLVIANVPGLVVTSATFPLPSHGTKFKLPFWKRMTGFTTMSEGVAATTNNITTGSEFATVQRAINAQSVYDTAVLVSEADPIAEISLQLARLAAEYIDGKLVLEADKTPNVKNITGTGAGTITVDGLISALTTTIGDGYGPMIANGAIVMHSKVYGDLLTLGVIQNNYQSGMDAIRTGQVGMLLGMPVFISDRVTTATVSSVLNYNTYVLGKEALALFWQREMNVEMDRNILTKETVISTDMHFATHLFGYDDQTSAVVAEQNKSIHVVKVVSK